MCSDLVAVHRSVVPDLPFSLYQDPSLPPSPSNPNLNCNSNSNSNSKGADPSPSPSLALSAGSSGRGWADADPVPDPVPVPVPPASSALRVLRYCMETAATVAGALTSLLREDDLGPVSFEPSQQQQSDETQPQPIEKESGAASSRIQWGFLAPMAVLKLSSKTKTKTDRTAPARGSLILRLLPATRGQVGS